MIDNIRVELKVLDIIFENEIFNQHKIAMRANFTQQTVSRAIKKLVAEKVLIKRPNGRETLFSFTSDGRTLYFALKKFIKETFINI